MTYVFLGPVNVHSSLSFLLIGMEMSFSFYTKQGVSEQNGFQYIFALRRKCNNVHIKTKNIFSFSKKCADTGRGGGGDHTSGYQAVLRDSMNVQEIDPGP